jgi:hypothetical protein
MELAVELERALAGVCAGGPAEVHENGQWLAALDGPQYQVRAQGDRALLHFWSSQQSLVRRVVRVAEQSPERVVLEVSRFGRARSAKLEFLAAATDHRQRRCGREQFRSRLHQLLSDRFPDEIVDSLAIGADLHHSISGSYTRGLMHRGADAFAVLSAGPGEDSARIDGILTFGLIWLDLTRNRARRHSVRGLRLFLPRGTSAITAHRLTALASPQEIELYEYDSLHWRMRRIAISDAGNLETWLVSRPKWTRHSPRHCRKWNASGVSPRKQFASRLPPRRRALRCASAAWNSRAGDRDWYGSVWVNIRKC